MMNTNAKHIGMAFDYGCENSTTSNAKAILNTYHQVYDNSDYQSLAEQMQELIRENKALKNDYEHLIEQFQRLTR